MHKIVLSTLCIGLMSAISFAQLPNPGFETWMNMGTYENPDGWSTLNDLTTSTGVYTATKGTPGSPGASYLKLTSKTVGSSVVNGVAVSGQIDPITQQPVSGFAFNQQPASFNGKWQHMIYGSSQGSINVTLTRWDATSNSRIIVATANKTLSGMAMSWANFTIPFVYADTQAPDSCIIVMKASGNNPTQDDYLWVDNLSFVGNVVGLNEESSFDSEMVLYPNPAYEKATILLNAKDSEKVQLEIYSLSGTMILSREIELFEGKNEIPVDITTITTGSYLINIFKGNKKTVLPITIR
jgi:hypothetical protein